MSKSEKLLAFEAALQESKELQEKFAAAQKRIIENKAASSDGEVLVKAAAEVGYTISVAEVERAFAQNQELSDEELGQVAGGLDYSCLGVYCCFVVLVHENSGIDGYACYSNYGCIFSEN